jgi:L-alanine-DL-glutamate epimerase-like enolase superfamily enzyme
VKIRSVDIFMLKYEQPLYLRPVVCRINTDEGLHGYGESALAFTFGASAAFHMVRELAELHRASLLQRMEQLGTSIRRAGCAGRSAN